MRKFFALIFILLISCHAATKAAGEPAGQIPPRAPSVQTVPNQIPNGLIVLLTDYGNRDFYLGAMKGRIYSIFPGAKIDTISNEVPPFEIREAAYLLAMSAPEFPPGTVFCVVVDPGEQTSGRTLVVETDDGKYYVAPDNGVLTLVLQQAKVRVARRVTNPLLIRTWASGVEGFRGTDVFGPTAAELSKGFPLDYMGPVSTSMERFKVSPPKEKRGEVDGEVSHVDWFGNIHTNIPADMLQKEGVAERRTLRIRIGSETVMAPLVKTYSEVGEGNWLALINDVGDLEIARNQTSANAILQVKAGTRVQVNF